MRYATDVTTMPTHAETVQLHAAHYHHLKTPVFGSREKYVLHLIHMHAYAAAARLSAGRTVLDLGCNIGEGSAILNRTAKKVVGVDVSESMIAEARKQHASLPIDFALVDGTTLPFADHSFDLVVSFQVIEHIVDQDSYLGEIRRVLAPGGVALFTTPNASMRLDPGMRPWNRFHVREYTFGELDGHLRSVFSSVQTLGLFAEEPLYSIEIGRTRAIRERVRRAGAEGRTLHRGRNAPPAPAGLGRRLRGIARDLLPSGVRGAIRRLAGKKAVPDQDIKRFIARYGPAHLAYLAERPDLAVDLAAIVTDNDATLQQAVAQLLSAGAGQDLSFRPPAASADPVGL